MSLAGPLRSEQARYLGLTLPALLFLAFFFLVPLAQMLWLSVSEPQLGLGNYRDIVEDRLVSHIWWTTLRICILTTVLSVVLGYVVSYAMTLVAERHRTMMIFCIIVTFSFSILVRAFAFTILLGGGGLINQVLIAAGLIQQPLRLLNNETGVVIGMLHYGLPVAVLALFSNMRGISPKFVDAARSLGASPLQAFTLVYLPLTKPGLISASILVFIYCLGFFIMPAMLGGGRVVMIAEYIRVDFEETLRWGHATMLATTLMVVVFVILAIMSRFIDLKKVFGG